MLHFDSQTGRLLHDEHMATIELLQALETLLDRHGAKKAPDLADPEIRLTLSNTEASLNREISRHFGFEEEHLFPLLANLGQVGMTYMLKAEHDAILPVAVDIARIAHDALAAWTITPESWKQFHELAQELIEREACHIQKEEMGLLAALAALVDAGEDARLATIFRSL
ncbi:MAG TPA: hemerythrin domain-containing protein [Azospirillaceae bacterium]|nr:hemerythrin domain-containing protein [Azospirillaceae bacterium]